MLRFYFKLAQKALIRHRYYTFINVFGLVCGMLSALIIAKYIGATLQLDGFHLNKDRIYTITQEQSIEGNQQGKRTAAYLGVADLITRFPEAVDFTKYYQHVEGLVMVEDDHGERVAFTENRIFISDSSFLKIFTFPLLHGNTKTALTRANSIVLTASTSRRYFGNTNPIGKTVTIRVSWGKETEYQVTGVTEDIPELSRFRFDFLITEPDLNPDEYWNVPDYSIYVLLRPNTESSALADKLTNILKEVPELKSTNRRVSVSLHPIADGQLSTEEYLLATVAIFIALISWVNYINQLIAQSYWRTRQIGIFRVMGATATNLRRQFLVESSLVCLTSMFLVIGIYAVFEQVFQTFTDNRLLPLIDDPTSINVIFFGIFALGITLSVAVQAIVHFSQDFGKILQNAFSARVGDMGARRVLVVIQFSISTVMIICVFVIANQLQYLKDYDKGINMDNILVVKAPMARDTTWNAKRKTLELFKQRCAELPFVTNVASSTTIPGEAYRHETYLSVQGNTDKTLVHQNGVDDHFFSLYEVEFVAGRGFIPDAQWKNGRSIVLNQSAAKALGVSDYDDIINTKIIDHEGTDVAYDVIGIVRDYHQISLKYEMRPMAFKYNVARGHSSLKVDQAALNESGLTSMLGPIKEIWKESYPDASFDYFFLTDEFEAQDIQDRHFGILFRYFTILSVIISCLGLFGLSLLISTKRQKEIGIRKTFGASSSAILTIFLRGYMGPLAVSLLLGSPIAYLMMNKWLENYAYRIEIGIGLVTLAVGTLVAIFLVTVSYSTIRSSFANPVRILRE